jgi:hypothetical protein
MGIDFSVRGATPEECRLFFSGFHAISQATENVDREIARATVMPKKPAPDPTCDEETGCAGCDCTGFDECEKCADPAPALTKKADIAAGGSSEPKPAKKTRAPGRNKGNKYGIPSELSKTDLKKYQRLWFRCSSKGIMYEEALAMEGKTKPRGISAKKPVLSNISQDLVDLLPDKAPPTNKEAGRRNPVNAGVENRPAGPAREKIKAVMAAIAASKEPAPVPVTMDKAPACEIVAGLHVRQIRPDAGRSIFGTALVLARPGEIVEVRDGGGQVHKILAACLEVVSTPASDRAAGEAS